MLAHKQLLAMKKPVPVLKPFSFLLFFGSYVGKLVFSLETESSASIFASASCSDRPKVKTKAEPILSVPLPKPVVHDVACHWPVIDLPSEQFAYISPPWPLQVIAVLVTIAVPSHFIPETFPTILKFPPPVIRLWVTSPMSTSSYVSNVPTALYVTQPVKMSMVDKMVRVLFDILSPFLIANKVHASPAASALRAPLNLFENYLVISVRFNDLKI